MHIVDRKFVYVATSESKKICEKNNINVLMTSKIALQELIGYLKQQNISKPNFY